MQLRKAGNARSLLLVLYFSLGAVPANTNDQLLLVLSNGRTVSLPE